MVLSIKFFQFSILLYFITWDFTFLTICNLPHSSSSQLLFRKSYFGDPHIFHMIYNDHIQKSYTFFLQILFVTQKIVTNVNQMWHLSNMVTFVLRSSLDLLLRKHRFYSMVALNCLSSVSSKITSHRSIFDLIMVIVKLNKETTFPLQIPITNQSVEKSRFFNSSILPN